MANTSQGAALLKFGQTWFVDGYGMSHQKSHGRPRWMSGKSPRHRHREERHRLGEAVDRGAPLLLEEQEDRRDERAGVADADPPDEVGDVEGPGDRDVVAPRADADDSVVPSEMRQKVSAAERGEEEATPPLARRPEDRREQARR